MKYDLIIVGAGIVGLSTAMHILKKSQKINLLIIEKENKIAMHQTGRNSGVIHSGIYYKPNSLKSKNCIKGRKSLIDFCKKEGINFDICGKIIVATNEYEVAQLHKLNERSRINGLSDTKILSIEEIKDKEPYCNGISGLFVPQTGIINYLDVAEKYAQRVKESGGEILFNNEVQDIIQRKDFIEVRTSMKSWKTKFLITCSGLYSDRLAKLTNPNLPMRITPFRGEYYLLKPQAVKYVKNLIYPVPNKDFPFLGVHFTRMINGGIECGPNAVFAFAREGYKKTSFNCRDTFESLTWPGFLLLARKYWKEGFNEFYRSTFKKAFVRELQKIIPDINSDDLQPGESGVRAQACGIDGKLIDDFYYIVNENIIHICNAPSPAATASLAIGDDISEKILKKI